MQELDAARRDLTYIDGALHVFGYGKDPAEIKTRRFRPRPRLFGRLQRTIFDMLRRSPDGIDTAEFTNCIMRQKGWDALDSDLRASVTHKVRNILWKLRKPGRNNSEDAGPVNVWTLAR